MVTALGMAMKQLVAFNQQNVNQIHKTLIEPLINFGSVFPSLIMAVKQQEQALKDYRRLKVKVEKHKVKDQC